MKSIIFFTNGKIYPADYGGTKIILSNIIREKLNYDKVIIFSIYPKLTLESLEFFKDKQIECINLFYLENKILLGLFKLMVFIKSLFSKYSYITSLNLYTFRKKINEINKIIEKLKNEGYKIDIRMENFVTVPAFVRLFNYNSFDNIFVCLHNYESELLKENVKFESKFFKKIIYLIEYFKYKNLEKKLDLLSTKSEKIKLIFLSDWDMKKYHEKGYFLNSKYAINQNILFIENKIIRKVDLKNPFFMFSGSLNFPPNFNGIMWLLSSKYIINDFQIIITGSYSKYHYDKIKKYSNVILKGFVNESELYELYSKCLAVLSPIQVGSGIKIKCLEAIQLNVPIIMTEFAARGISTDKENVYVVNNDYEFWNKMKEIYQKTYNALGK